MNPARRSELDLFVTRWDELVAGEVGGEELLEMQRGLALEAVGKLGPSRELEVFLDYLRERGAGDLQREMLTEGLRTLFAGPEAAEAREWALRYAKDRPTREALMHLAGEEYRGPGFVAFFERVAVEGCHNSQASLLAGYCTTLARTNPEASLKTYRDLGYPFRIDNTGMRYLMAAFPPETDFLNIAANEIGEDDRTLAKANRAVLLENWAGNRPREAAQYVVANTATVHADQLGVVMRTWAREAPAAAAAWLDTAPPGAAHDEGRLALSHHWLDETNGPAAWEQAAKIADFNARVAAATEVFQSWATMDRDAATAAWIELFPGAGSER